MPVLKEMADAMILPIVPDRIAGEEAPHEFGNPLEPPEHQDMDRIAHQHPGKDSGSSVFGDLRDEGEKIAADFILAKDGLPFGSSDHHVMQGLKGISSGLTRHATLLPQPRV